MIYPRGSWTREAGSSFTLQMDEMEVKQGQARSEEVMNSWPSHHELWGVLQC